nr:condensation domain-containing protein [uncultured bacterium]
MQLLRRRLAAQGLASPSPIEPIKRRDAGEPAPLSAAQRRMWFLQQLQPHSVANNICVGIRLRGGLDVAAFRAALRDTLGRHDVLRTVYRAGPGGNPEQVVLDGYTLAVPLRDCADVPERQQESLIDELACEIGSRAFELSAEPPVELTLLRMSDQEHVLLLVAHHIAWDDSSWGLLLNEVALRYRSGANASLPSIPVQYGDFAAWEQARTFDRDALDYWRKRLLPAPEPLALPVDFPRTATLSESGGRRTRALPADLADRVRVEAQRAGVTPFMLLLAAFTAVLHRYSGTHDIAIGSPVVNRDRPEVAGLVGNFGNMVVLRTDLGGEPTFSGLLERVRATCTEAYAHQAMPFDTLVAPAAAPNTGPLGVLRRDVLAAFADSARLRAAWGRGERAARVQRCRPVRPVAGRGAR